MNSQSRCECVRLRVNDGRDCCNRTAPRPRDRDAFLGLRQLRNPLPRLSLARRRPDRPRAHRGCRARAPADGLLPDASRCTSRGTRSTTTRRFGATPRSKASASARSIRTCSGRTTIDSAASATRTQPSAHGRSTTAASASRSPRRSARRSSASGSPTARTTPARTTSAADTRGSWRAWRSCTQLCRPECGCSSSTSSSSRASTAPTFPTGEPRRCVCRRLGPQAQVLVDTGHHPQGTNVEQIVALLLAEGLLGGFHFNNRKYADDDLIVGSIDPFELFRIMREIAHGAGGGERRLHDRPVAQRRGEDRRDDPVGHEHPDGVREGAARGRGRVLPRRSAQGDVLGAHRDPARCVRDRRAAAARPTQAGARSRPRPGRGVPRRRLRRALAQRAGHGLRRERLRAP